MYVNNVIKDIIYIIILVSHAQLNVKHVMMKLRVIYVQMGM